MGTGRHRPVRARGGSRSRTDGAKPRRAQRAPRIPNLPRQCLDERRVAGEDAPQKASRLTSMLPRIERSLAKNVLP